MIENKTNAKLWATVTVLVSVIACIGTITAAIIEKIPVSISVPSSLASATYIYVPPAEVAPANTSVPISTGVVRQNTPVAAISTSTPIVSQVTKTIYVNADSSAWTETGVYVQSGQKVIIQASGKVTTWEGNSVGDSYPDGNDWVCDEAGCILNGAKYGALIGQIGNGSVFLVGSNYQSAATSSGYLYLRMNDVSSSYLDNSGSYTVSIETE